ncbi:hypothetical protein [Rhodoblastus sp.]|uniref:hypothetical protein n=1 Tax=Rhodoblastus sp. TaxID=1962975 RepID=UPI003F9E5954
MNGRRSTKPRFELSPERFGGVVFARFRFALSRERGASFEVEAQIAAWVNEGGAGGEVRR